MASDSKTSNRAADLDTSESDLNVRLSISLGVVLLLILGVGGWAANANLSGAVIAPGQVVVETNVKKVQHPTGGVIGEIRVKSGDHVQAGDLLLRLDDTQTRANLGIVTSQLTELTGRRARLDAESEGSEAILFPAKFGTDSTEQGQDESRVLSGERRLFFARRNSSESKKSQLHSRIDQMRSEIIGLNKQEKAKSRELKLVRLEIDRLEILNQKRLLPATRMLAMQRDEARIEGEHGALLAQLARVGAQIHETELQIIDIDDTIKTEAQKELREVEARIAELEERRIAAEDVMSRVELRAPKSGIVHELAVHTIGGVVAPGDTLMAIVPEGDHKSIEVRLQPTDIDQVTIGQLAVLRFPAFNQRTTPELKGNIARLAADVTMDPQTGIPYYTARVSVTDDELRRLGKNLVPGMPVESMIQTGERTALSYMTKPLSDNLARTFKEE